VPTVFLESDDGLRLPLIVLDDLDGDGVELLAASIGALAENAPAVTAEISGAQVEIGPVPARTDFASEELHAAHQVVEFVVTDAGLPIVEHDSFHQSIGGVAIVPPGEVQFTLLTVQAGDLVGRFQLQGESGLPKGLFRYWAHGEGADKIRWGSKGDFTRCVGFLREHVGEHAEGTCANLHKDATGKWPAEKTAAEIVSFADDDTVTVDDLVEAAEAADRVRAGRRVTVTPADAVLVVEDLAADTEATDLTLVTLRTVNGFSVVGGVFGNVAHNQLARGDMPQIPGDRLDAFREFLAERGHAVREAVAHPNVMFATQNELDARKVGKFVQAARTGALDDQSPIWISSDLRLLDGHSRWAAFLLLSEAEHHGLLSLDVMQADLPISRLVDLARRFTELDGIESREHGELGFNPRQPRHPAGSPVGGQWAPTTSPTEHRVGSRLLIGPAGRERRLLLDPSQGAAAPDHRQVSLRDLHGLTRRSPMIQAKPQHLEGRTAELYGTGDIDEVFNGAATTVPPFRPASRRKDEQLFDRDVVAEALSGRTRLREIDPRVLHSTQRGITRDGVDYYLGDEFSKTGATYADQNNPGNRHPVLYRHERSGQWLILGGHHRATAALIKGEPLLGIVITNRTPIRPDPNEFAAATPTPLIETPNVAGSATVDDGMYRDVTSLLAIDESNDGADSVADAVILLNANERATVRTEADAVAVLVELGAAEADARQRVAWANGAASELA
jgi:hypothetical protein